VEIGTDKSRRPLSTSFMTAIPTNALVMELIENKVFEVTGTGVYRFATP
jgi:hypothetical protein